MNIFKKIKYYTGNGYKRKKIILISSDGGHLAQILQLKDMFLNYDYLLITERTPATSSLKTMYNIKYLRPRSKGKKRQISFFLSIFLNLFLCMKIILFHFPKVIITTGSHTAVPMCYLGKLLRVKIIFILSFARLTSRAKTADIVYPIANKFIVQWPEAKLNYKKAIYLGGIY
jgi:beta-1,4-N-acetylglucosaminyltransferase